ADSTSSATTTPMPDGLVVVDKDAGWTSHDVVAKLRGILQTKKVGHSGTLDPDATGVLLIGVGKVTRLLRFLTALPKTYTGEVVFGVETATLDASGDVTATHDMSVTIEGVRAAAAREPVENGKVLARSDLQVEGDGPWAVVDGRSGELLAVYEAHRDGTVKPAVVIA